MNRANDRTVKAKVRKLLLVNGRNLIRGGES